MPRPDHAEPGSPPSIEEFLGEPTRDLGKWKWLWEGDRTFPIRSHRSGFLGRLIIAAKRWLRPLVKAPQADLLDRQKAFNLVVLEYLDQVEALGRTIDTVRDDLMRDLSEVRTDLLRDVQNNHRRISHLEAFKRDGFGDVMRHSDALHALLDQKLDRYRRESEEMRARLSSLLAGVEEAESETEPGQVADRWREQSYVALEDRFRGTAEEIRERARPYLSYFASGDRVLDLGCGRGESLQLLAEQGLEARGIDLSQEMVDHCVRSGLNASRSDLIAELRRCDEQSLEGIISLHVIEHLPNDVLDRLIRLSWRALKPGGVLILETPNPMSLVVSGRDFWRDPTHLRPVHPETLALAFEMAGFDPVERLELRPFAEEDRIPEVDLNQLAADAKPLGAALNSMRDRVDRLLYGNQDYAIVGTRPRV